jgi:hypothetical protein
MRNTCRYYEEIEETIEIVRRCCWNVNNSLVLALDYQITAPLASKLGKASAYEQMEAVNDHSIHQRHMLISG